MMTNGTTVKQRDIILIPFPYSDLSQEKKRPAVIISDSEYNTHNEDVICCAITSNPREYHQSIEINNQDLDDGSLMFNSRVKPSKIFALNQSSVIKRLARLNIPKSKEVVKQLNISIKIEE
ncbi:type II toxin-antitoxin system PemK/MazF family toxin [Candidatus Woesearchaeota archaeon]|nr:type II toxin-antitoxin system PemK/MazF family toxin [Candidatus Woesearchaeota archaeon]